MFPAHLLDAVPVSKKQKSIVSEKSIVTSLFREFLQAAHRIEVSWSEKWARPASVA